MPEKLNIFIDTNTLVHIAEFEFHKMGPDKWLWDHFSVHICNEISQEFNRRLKDKRIKIEPGLLKRLNRKIKDSKISIKLNYRDSIENNIILNYYYNKPKTSNDKGERDLICTAIAKIFYKQLPYTVIVTDDQSARGYFMDSVLDSFPFGNIWDVFDLVLYYYYTSKKVSDTEIINAIRDLSAMTSISPKNFKTKMLSDVEARMQLYKFNMSRFEKIKHLKNILPQNYN